MLQRLVADIRAVHLFSDAWPEERWLSELPALESEVLASRSRTALLIALSHLSTSLRDGHLAFTPSGGWEDPSIAVVPVTFFQAGSPLAPRFFVRDADPETQLGAGDELVSYDGIDTADLLQHFRFSIDRSSPGARAQRLTELLSWRQTQVSPGILGSTVEVRVRRGDRVASAALVFQRNGPPPPSSEEPPPHGRAECAAPPRDYGQGYELARASRRLCLYRSNEPALVPYPIVRHVSFFYGDAGIDYEALGRDREMLRAFLHESPPLSGILLDLRDNAGGHHAGLFLPWYLGQRFGTSAQWVRLHPQLVERERLERALGDRAAVHEYLRRAEAGERFWVRSFRCPPSECPAQADVPLARVPVALLVGPACVSACDDFFEVWRQHSAGPTVGASPAAMGTAIRYPLLVQLGHEVLGEFTVALSGTRSSDGGLWREGAPAAVGYEVEPVWPPLAFEQTIVRTAIAALGKDSKAQQ